MSEVCCRKKKLVHQKRPGGADSLGASAVASRRREELLKVLDQLEPGIAELDRAVWKKQIVVKMRCC